MKTLTWGELGKIVKSQKNREVIEMAKLSLDGQSNNARALVLELRCLNSERASAKSDEERIRLSDKIIVLKRELRACGYKGV